MNDEHTPDTQPVADEQRTNTWAMVIHLSALSVFVFPIVGLVVPIVIWQIKKHELPGIDPHGKMVTNWLISAFIYWLISFVLSFILIGFPLMFALAVVAVIFPVIGGIKANDGVLWKYPITIEFLK
jgi:uncharacterized Tic20 family protein